MESITFLPDYSDSILAAQIQHLKLAVGAGSDVVKVATKLWGKNHAEEISNETRY